MRNQHTQQTALAGLMQSVMTGKYAQRCLGDDAIGDEFDWESETGYAGEALASDVLAFIRECD